MRMLDISPYCWEKMVLTMGSTLLHSETSKYLAIEKLDLETLLSHVDREMQHTREFYGIQFPNINRLRAALVQTTLLLSTHNKRNSNTRIHTDNISITSLTTPHKSLIS